MTCDKTPDCNCFDCFTNLDQETPVSDPCNIKTCVNYVPGIGRHCMECKLLWRAFIATDASDVFTFEQYVQIQQEDAKNTAEQEILYAEYEERNAQEEAELTRIAEYEPGTSNWL